MSGGGAPIFFGSIRLFTSGCACERWGFDMFMHILLEWPRALPSGSTNFFQSLSVFRRPGTTFLRRELLPLALIGLSVKGAESLRSPIRRRGSCAVESRL